MVGKHGALQAVALCRLLKSFKAPEAVWRRAFTQIPLGCGTETWCVFLAGESGRSGSLGSGAENHPTQPLWRGASQTERRKEVRGAPDSRVLPDFLLDCESGSGLARPTASRFCHGPDEGAQPLYPRLLIRVVFVSSAQLFEEERPGILKRPESGLGDWTLRVLPSDRRDRVTVPLRYDCRKDGGNILTA